MALHGCKGQAVNGNSLMPTDFHFGYEINYHLRPGIAVPHLIPITKEQSYTYQVYLHQQIKVAEERIEEKRLKNLKEGILDIDVEINMRKDKKKFNPAPAKSLLTETDQLTLFDK